MDYSKFKLKEYALWDLYMQDQQYPYLGRCYAWAKRENAETILDMDLHETSELFEIVIPEWNESVKQCFQHDRVNVACLCNTAHHLHWHLIPRYFTPRTFAGIEFIDSRPEHNYAPYEKRKIDEKTLLEIKEKIRYHLK